MYRRIERAEPPAAPSKLARLVRVAIAAAVLAAPAAAWLARMAGVRAVGDVLAFALAGIVALTLMPPHRGRAFGIWFLFVMIAVAGILFTSIPLAYLPCIALNIAAAALFGASLAQDEPLVCRFARARGAPLDASTERYCRRLTIVWAVWLALLALTGVAIALHGDDRLGAWWCGALDYACIAVLFVGEYAYRRISGRDGGNLFAQLRDVLRVLERREE